MGSESAQSAESRAAMVIPRGDGGDGWRCHNCFFAAGEYAKESRGGDTWVRWETGTRSVSWPTAIPVHIISKTPCSRGVGNDGWSAPAVKSDASSINRVRCSSAFRYIIIERFSFFLLQHGDITHASPDARILDVRPIQQLPSVVRIKRPVGRDRDSPVPARRCQRARPLGR